MDITKHKEGSFDSGYIAALKTLEVIPLNIAIWTNTMIKSSLATSQPGTKGTQFKPRE